MRLLETLKREVARDDYIKTFYLEKENWLVINRKNLFDVEKKITQIHFSSFTFIFIGTTSQHQHAVEFIVD